MKAGQVVRLRVNPKDCQSILDVLDRIGMPVQNMSFSQCASMALASLLETARINKTIPEPDPFQYLNRMESFVGNGTVMQRKRVQAAHAIGAIGEHFAAPAVTADTLVRPASTSTVPTVVSEDIRGTLQDRRRLSELVSKKDMCDSGMPGMCWGASDELEYQQLYKIIYPEG